MYHGVLQILRLPNLPALVRIFSSLHVSITVSPRNLLPGFLYLVKFELVAHLLKTNVL